MRQDVIELEDIKENEEGYIGKPPERRIKGAKEAAQIVWKLVDANKLRAQTDAEVKGNLDGNPPYSPEALRKHGQASRTNVNFREGEGLKEAAETPYYDLFAEAPYYAAIALQSDRQWEAQQKSRIVTEEWNDMLREWDEFDFNMQMAVSNLVCFGRGFVMWEDEDSWQYTWVKYSRVLVPDGTANSLKKVEVLVIRQQWLLSDLWSKIKNKSESKEMGWNPAAVARAMTKATTDLQSGSIGDDYEYWQERLRNNDLAEATGNKTVRAAHVLVREYSGKVTHLIVEERGTTGQPPATGESADGEMKFLYEKRDRFESFRQVLGSLFFDLGDGTWHSVKGLLVKMHPFIQLKNRTNCAVVDNMFLNLSVLLKATSPKALETLSLIQIGPMSVLPPETEVVQWGVTGRMEEGLAVDNHLERKLSANIGTYRQTLRRTQGNPDTATKVLADEAKEASLSKGAVNRFYGQLDHIFRETFMRSIKGGQDESTEAGRMAKAFQERCAKRGVTLADLKKVRFVRAYRNMGNGSIFMRQQSVQSMLPVVMMLNEAGRQNWLDDYIAATSNQEMVERWNPKGNYNPTLDDDRVTAALQVAAAKDGVAPVITDAQNHVIFADTFRVAAVQSTESLQQGGNPEEVLAFLETIGPALAQHMQAIASDPSRKQIYNALKPRFDQLGQITDQLHRKVAQMRQQQQAQAQKQQQVMSDEDIAQFKAQKDAARRDWKAGRDMDLKSQKTNQALAINDLKTAQTLELNRIKAQESNGNGESS